MGMDAKGQKRGRVARVQAKSGEVQDSKYRDHSMIGPCRLWQGIHILS